MKSRIHKVDLGPRGVGGGYLLYASSPQAQSLNHEASQSEASQPSRCLPLSFRVQPGRLVCTQVRVTRSPSPQLLPGCSH